MAGASFGTGFNAVAGMPKPPRLSAKPKPLGASLTGLHNPMQHPGASLTGLTAAQPPKQTAPTVTPPKASATTTTPAQSPLDSTYYQQIAADQLKLGNQVNGLTAQSQNDNTALQSALAQLAYQQPRDSLRLEQGANRRGALYSSAYTQDLGNLGNQYLTRQTSATTANTQKQAGIAAQIAALNQAEPITEAGDYDAAVARAVKAALANPATGQAPISTPPPANPPSTTINGRPAPKGTFKKDGTLNVNVPKVRSGFGYRGGF
jgi:hypothetical protein